MRGPMIGWMVVAALLLGLSIGHASDRGMAAAPTFRPSSAGERGSGSLPARQSGRQMRVALTIVAGHQPSTFGR